MDLQTLIVLIIELIGTIAFFNFGGNGRYSPKDGYFWRAGAWSGDRGRRRNDA